ncbi:MAG: hypothetical protein ACRD6N_06950 [Pyrinomonadaceae bacterium]
MISKTELDDLRERDAKPGSPVLSVYLDTDQAKAVNQQRGYEVVFKNLLREVEETLDKDERKQFREDAERVQGFLDYYREPQRGLIIFSDDSEDFFWSRELRTSVRDGLWWNDTPQVRPLTEILDEHERYTVVLTDRQQARLFTIFLGEIEEHYQAFAQADVKHIKAPGQERAWAQSKIQHKADGHAHWHLKHVAEMMSRLTLHHRFDRLILAGTEEVTSELASLLPKALRARIVRSISLPVEATDKEVLDQTLKIEEAVERAREAELVESLITAASKGDKAVLGLDDTLLALQEWRVRQLIYVDGFTTRGGQCTHCGALLITDAEPCAYCGGTVRGILDLVAWTDGQAMEMGKVEQVRGPAGNRLREAGNIGALLRF